MFDKFQSFYLTEKQKLERRGEMITGNFDKFLEPKNRVKFTEDELNIVFKELKEIIFYQEKIINNKISELDTKLKQRG